MRSVIDRPGSGGRERRRRFEIDPGEWQHDPWDDAEVVDALVIERSRRSRWPVRATVWTVGVLLLAAMLVLGATGWWYLDQINPKGDPAAAINFTVEDADTVESLSLRFQEQGIVTNARVFRWYVERQGGLEVTPGLYVLRPLDHMGNLMRVLSTPPADTYSSVTFPEGFTLAKMATRIATEVPTMGVDDFLAATQDRAITSEWQDPGVISLEGLLFPDTYQVSNGESAVQVVERMVALMERVGRQEDIVVKGYVQGLTAYKVLIIASMVEREAKVESDRPLIARVILNRLRLGMPLQIDATLYYDQPLDTPFSTLKVLDTPYNTYLHTGLPPTPIANPGRASIKAVLNPANNPPAGGALCQNLPREQCQYLYYVLADADGSHAFAITLAEHEANVAKALAAGLL